MGRRLGPMKWDVQNLARDRRAEPREEYSRQPHSRIARFMELASAATAGKYGERRSTPKRGSSPRSEIA